LQLLVSNRANLQVFDKEDHTMLWVALTQQKADCMDVLLKNSANLLEEYGASKDTPMHVATEAGYVAGVQRLLSMMQPAEVQMLTESKNAAGFTPLATAVHNAQPEVFKLLIDSGAVRNPPLEGGENLLHIAAKAELASSALVASLVDDCGVDVNQQNAAGLTALHIAAGHESFDAAVRVRLLLLHKANINQVDSEGKTALHHAALAGASIHMSMRVVLLVFISCSCLSVGAIGALEALLELGADEKATYADQTGQVMTPQQAAGKRSVQATLDFFAKRR
jgi:ankyrin repeat protein